MTGHERRPTPEEVRLWRQAMGVSTDVDPPADHHAEPPANDEPESVCGGPQTRPPRPLAPPLPGDLDRHAARALRRGVLRIEDRLDLHGMTQAAALTALARFLSDSAAGGMKCVLVITGKGGRTHIDTNNMLVRSDAGVLRDAVPRWLAGPELAPLVVGSRTALPRDGGQGARYVLLRPQR